MKKIDINQKINVETRHIIKGKRFEPRRCPVALAIEEQVIVNGQHPIYVSVSSGELIIRMGDNRIDDGVKLPRSAISFYRRFDKTRSRKLRYAMTPFSFFLRARL